MYTQEISRQRGVTSFVHFASYRRETHGVAVTPGSRSENKSFGLIR